jgi:hypothetical protein
MKYFNKNKVLGSIVLALALVFVVGFAGASAAHAQYYAYGTNNSYAYQYGGTYAYTYPTYTPTNYYAAPVTYYAPLTASCYPTASTAYTGNTVTWTSSVSGGNGSYSYSWSGTDSLSGYSSSVAIPYYSPGVKTASVTIYSNGQSQTIYCNGSVNVYSNAVYTQPVYYPSNPSNYYNNYTPLTAYCSPNTTSAPVGSPILWSATVTGGNGSYNYNWSGTDGIAGYNQNQQYVYNSPGLKTASVTVSSGGQVITEMCNGSVNVGGYQTGYQAIPTTVIGSNNNGSLDIGCYADPSSTSVNQPVTWNIEATGGAAPYTYSWTGSDGLTGSQSSVIKYYSSSGSKSAIVTVTSADGKTGTHACTNAVSVGRPGGNYTAPAQTNPAPAAQPTNILPAAALFSLSGIPWGWISVLIILVLFGVVLYLVFNRSKI